MPSGRAATSLPAPSHVIPRSSRQLCTALRTLLARCGDVEPNPGPKRPRDAHTRQPALSGRAAALVGALGIQDDAAQAAMRMMHAHLAQGGPLGGPLSSLSKTLCAMVDEHLPPPSAATGWAALRLRKALLLGRHSDLFYQQTSALVAGRCANSEYEGGWTASDMASLGRSVTTAFDLGAHQNLTHIAAAAALLQRPVACYYPGFSAPDAPRRCPPSARQFSFVFPPLLPAAAAAPAAAPLVVFWTRCGDDAAACPGGSFQANHFCAGFLKGAALLGRQGSEQMGEA